MPCDAAPQAKRSAQAANHNDIAQLSLSALKRLPAEVLRLHLSLQYSVMTGSVTTMVTRRHNHCQGTMSARDTPPSSGNQPPQAHCLRPATDGASVCAAKPGQPRGMPSGHPIGTRFRQKRRYRNSASTEGRQYLLPVHHDAAERSAAGARECAGRHRARPRHFVYAHCTAPSDRARLKQRIPSKTSMRYSVYIRIPTRTYVLRAARHRRIKARKSTQKAAKVVGAVEHIIQTSAK